MGSEDVHNIGDGKQWVWPGETEKSVGLGRLHDKKEVDYLTP